MSPQERAIEKIGLKSLLKESPYSCNLICFKGIERNANYNQPQSLIRKYASRNSLMWTKALEALSLPQLSQRSLRTNCSCNVIDFRLRTSCW